METKAKKEAVHLKKKKVVWGAQGNVMHASEGWIMDVWTDPYLKEVWNRHEM